MRIKKQMGQTSAVSRKARLLAKDGRTWKPTFTRRRGPRRLRLLVMLKASRRGLSTVPLPMSKASRLSAEESTRASLKSSVSLRMKMKTPRRLLTK